MARTAKLFGDKAYKRTARDVQEERDMGYGRLHDYWHNTNVHLRWSNERGQYEDDQIFIMEVRGKGQTIKMALSKEEILRFLRYV